jgi:hypothetical protein
VNTIATKHAYKRAKKRFSWNASALDRMMDRAFYGGITHKDVKGQLNKYICDLWLKHRFCNNVRIYGEDVYFFCDNRLITLYRLDNKLIKMIPKASKLNDSKTDIGY